MLRDRMIAVAAGMLMTGPLAGVVAQSALPVSQPADTRSIIAEEFLKARPGPARGAKAKPGTYRRVTPPSPKRGAVADMGVTIWRLRPPRTSDGDVRLLVHQGSAVSQWIPERIEAATRLAEGDRLRLSVESPRAGYLYVINAEQYGDGTSGDAYLIFPTTRVHAGDNRVTAGRIVEVPAQDDQPPFFTLQRSRSDHIGELLTILISPAPLAGLSIGAKPIQLDKLQLSVLESTGHILMERFEMEGGAGRLWTKEEQAAGADRTRLLTSSDPGPQTIYRGSTEPGKVTLIKLQLRYAQ
jgi:hypothetical protein